MWWRSRQFLVILVLCFLDHHLLPVDGWAQVRRYKPGDEVQVFFLNKWWDAQVVDTNARREVMAEFEFAGTAKRQVFRAGEVRWPYEADALGPARSWSDASGSFRVQAALLAVDAETLTLRKPDMTEVKVPINRLSDSDQSFVRRLKKEMAPPPDLGLAPPPIEQFSIGSGLAVNFSGGGSQRIAMDPDPLPSYLKLQQAGVAFPAEEFFDRLGGVLPLGGTDAWVLAVLENDNPGKPIPSRLLWASLTQQKIGGRQLLPPGEAVLDYHPRSHRLLTYSSVKREGDAWGEPVLTVWEVLPTDKEVKPVVRWSVKAEERGPNDPWARIVDGNVVLHRWTPHDFVAWDLSSKSTRYRTTQEAFFELPVSLSGNRRYLLIPEDKTGVRILEAATGRVVGTLPSEKGATAVAVSGDGRRAAVLNASELLVWDLTDPAAQPDRYQAEAIGTPFGTELSWVDDQRLMAGSGHQQVLFSLPHRLALWNYQFDSAAVRAGNGRRLHDIVDGHLVYAASLRSGSQHGFAVGAVQLPGPKVNETAASLDRASLLVLKAGSTVRLDVRADAHTERVRAALLKEIEANGWTVSSSSSISVIAEMKRGETQQVTYRSFGGGEQTATVTPFISALRVDVGDKVAWQTGTSSGAPPVISMREGESVQLEIDKWQRPYPEFFETVDIPQEITDPAKRLGLGTTHVTTRGLVPN